jgi:hypothetical protein
MRTTSTYAPTLSLLGVPIERSPETPRESPNLQAIPFFGSKCHVTQFSSVQFSSVQAIPLPQIQESCLLCGALCPAGWKGPLPQPEWVAGQLLQVRVDHQALATGCRPTGTRYDLEPGDDTPSAVAVAKMTKGAAVEQVCNTRMNTGNSELTSRVFLF